MKTNGDVACHLYVLRQAKSLITPAADISEARKTMWRLLLALSRKSGMAFAAMRLLFQSNS